MIFMLVLKMRMIDGKYRVYSDEYINSILDKYGYKKGGRVSKPEDEFVPTSIKMIFQNL
jgi:hypothetical protein